jgi:hypothetical protein
MADDDALFSGSSYTNKDKPVWEALVELARAIVLLNDKHKGEGCDYASVSVTTWSPCMGVEMRHIDLTFSMPRAMVDAALHRAGVLKHDDELAKTQEIWASQIEME